MADELKTVDQLGQINGAGSTWEEIVRKQIDRLASTYTGDDSVNKILAKWHNDITQGVKRNPNFSPHVNGFYSIFMVHGTWYEKYKEHMGLSDAVVYDPDDPDNYEGSGEYGNPAGLGDLSTDGAIKVSNVETSFNMLATDIDVPDVTEEYISVSSRIRNSFVPSRNYFVSDFSISYIENINLEVIRYHEAWMKYLELLKRGEVEMYNATECKNANRGPFLDMPFTNAIWVVVFHPFTTDIQLLIKLIGVMPVTMPLKQVIGNRSNSKMTVLNMQYKATDMFYKFYNGSKDMLADDNLLASSFRSEILKALPDA